jgi:hypothetical protein
MNTQRLLKLSATLVLMFVTMHLITSQDWLEIKDFLASDYGAGDYTGYSISIDGDIAAVGAYRTSDPSMGSDGTETGAVYILYRNQGGTNNWGELKKIYSSDRYKQDYFGWSVCLSGTYLIVGAPYEDHDADGGGYLPYAGSAYIFYKDQGSTDNWGEVAKIVAGDREENDAFGTSVSISGNYAVVGAYQEDEDASGGNPSTNSGSAYIFYKDQDGADKWGQIKKIVAGDREIFDDTPDQFGYSVSISGDNIIVGANTDRDDYESGGAIYIFNRNQDGPNNWGEVKKIRPSDLISNDEFGCSVDISGNMAIAGAYKNNSSGSAYIYYQGQGGTNNWGQVKKIESSDGEMSDWFGYRVSISDNYAIAGAPYEDDNLYGQPKGDYSGAAYIFGKNYGGTDNWGEVTKIIGNDSEYGSNFGHSVAITNEFSIAGAPDFGVGKAYIYKPYTQAGNISFNNIQDDRFTIQWTIGNGDKRVAFVSSPEINPHLTPEPGDNITYLADPLYKYGTGSYTNGGWYTVYNGTGNTVTVTGLTEGEVYKVMVCEYIGSTGTEKYANIEVSGNPSSQCTFTDLSAVTIDIANGKLNSTTTFMEYSLNSTNGVDGNWYPCTAVSTDVTYDPGNVYVHGANQDGNYRLVANIADPATAPSFTIDYTDEKTVETIPSTIEYNNDNNFSTANSSGAGNQISLTPGTNVYFRYKATTTTLPSQVQELVVSDRPATPGFTINYTNEKTNEAVPNSVEYNTDNNFATPNSIGMGTTLALTPGENVYFRVKATSSSFVSNVQTLFVPSRPSAPNYTIDYSAETTAENIESADEYSAFANMSGAVTGPGTKIQLTPGTDLYFREKVTLSSFSGEIQHLVVPARPVVVNFTIDYTAETTNEVVPSTVEYSANSEMTGSIAGAGTKITVTPGTNIYLRTKATLSSFAGFIQTLEPPSRPAAPDYTIDYTNERTNEAVLNSVEYNTDNNFTTPNSSGMGTYLALTPGTDIYFRVKPTFFSFASEVQTLDVPSRPPVTTYTIDYISETTTENVATADEYSVYPNMTSTVTGSGSKLQLTPGTDLYLRTKSTISSFSGEIQHLTVPSRPPITDYVIDYINETTTDIVPETDEYSTNPDMSDAITGNGSKTDIIPGTDLYFRTKSTSSSFCSDIQHLIVPPRPNIPTVSLSDKNSTTATFMKSSDGTGSQVTTADGYEYSVDGGANWDPIYSVITEVDASGLNNIIVHRASTSQSFRSLPTENLDSEGIPEVTASAQTSCNNEDYTIIAQSSTDNGKLYLILDGEPQSTQTELDAAVSSDKGASVNVSAANTDYQIPVSELVSGTYYAYAVNEIGELSLKGTNPIIVYETPTVSVGEDIFTCLNAEVILDAGTGFSQYLWTPGESTDQTLDVTEEGEYFVKVTDENGCSARDTVSVNFAEPYDQEQICLITIDLQSGKNLIIWEKTPDMGTILYRIYRQTNVVGEYEMIGEVPYDDLSIFKDTVADPEQRQWVYKITAVDTCNNESDIKVSPYHRPLFLQYTGTDDGVNLEWESYVVEGAEMEFLTYEIYRGSDSSALTKLDEISADLRVYKDKDNNALKYRYYYRIAGVKANPCYPTGSVKAESGPYSHSMSNLEDNRLQFAEGIDLKSAESLMIYPNPFSDYTTIRFTNPVHSEYKLLVRDLAGKAVMIISKITEEEVIIQRSSLKAGYYSVEVVGEKIFRGKMIVE